MLMALARAEAVDRPSRTVAAHPAPTTARWTLGREKVGACLACRSQCSSKLAPWQNAVLWLEASNLGHAERVTTSRPEVMKRHACARRVCAVPRAGLVTLETLTVLLVPTECALRTTRRYARRVFADTTLERQIRRSRAMPGPACRIPKKWARHALMR
jgi:hypothetical protein